MSNSIRDGTVKKNRNMSEWPALFFVLRNLQAEIAYFQEVKTLFAASGSSSVEIEGLF
jgi:hypothetical protein